MHINTQQNPVGNRVLRFQNYLERETLNHQIDAKVFAFVSRDFDSLVFETKGTVDFIIKIRYYYINLPKSFIPRL